MTIYESFNRLKEGNKRYAAGTPKQTVVSQELRDELFANGQHPNAAILGCADSRVPVETIFDAVPGELFVIRTGGNVVGDFELGSLEFAASQLKTPVIVVLGHDQCGAVNAAVSNEEFSSSMRSVIDEIRKCAPDVIGGDPEDIENKNIKYALSKIATNPVIANLAEKGALRLIAAKYSLKTGIVKFFERESQVSE